MPEVALPMAIGAIPHSVGLDIVSDNHVSKSPSSTFRFVLSPLKASWSTSSQLPGADLLTPTESKRLVMLSIIAIVSGVPAWEEMLSVNGVKLLADTLIGKTLSPTRFPFLANATVIQTVSFPAKWHL